MNLRATKTCGSKAAGCSKRTLQEQPVTRKRGFTGLVLTALIAILPKCPFCALAYSTAVTMCSGKMYVHEADWTSAISVLLGIITFGVVAWNYKGWKTGVALTSVTLGLALVILAEFYTGNPTIYYWGCGVILLGVWINGSFLHFMRKWFKIDSKVSVSTSEVYGGS